MEHLVEGHAVTEGSRLLDERSEPALRTVIGELMARSERADFAVTRIRLAAMDLTREEAAMTSCRVLLGALDASMLDDASAGAAARERQLGLLLDWVRSGRLQVRSAGIAGWSPDFSLFRSPVSITCLVGAHYFANPYHAVGPSLTCILRDPSASRIVADRFEALWARSHDVMPAIQHVLERAG